LVKNILDFSKIEEGKKEYEFAGTDIPLLVKNQLESFRQDEVNKDVKLSVRIAEDIPVIQADGDALARAFSNLLNNAVKFSREDPVLSVDVCCEENHVKISVKDRGIGISAGEIDRIFDKFYQGRNAQSLTVTGTGLGLTLVRHIAEAHGGRVEALSESGRGSTFSLFLPVERKIK
jgi:signal transduction histidine kinase